MIILLKLIILNCICVLGWKIAISDGMLLDSIGKWGDRKVEEGHKIYDLVVCPWCCGTAISIAAHLFAFGIGVLPLIFNWQLLIRWPLVVMGSSFICGNIWNIYETINRVRERNEIEAKFLTNQEQLSHFEIRDRKANHKQRFNTER